LVFPVFVKTKFFYCFGNYNFFWQTVPNIYHSTREWVFLFKILNGIDDTHATTGMMELNTQAITRGHNKKLKKQSCRLNVRKYSFTSRVVNIWNSLSEEIIVAKTVKEFGLDKHWKQRVINSIQNFKYLYSCILLTTVTSNICYIIF
jgi:hypothetical protein